MDNVILTEAFKELKLLEEEAFDVNSTEDMEDAKEFIEDDIDVEPVIEIADVYADEENELLDSYVGKVILECEVCHSKIFEDADKVTVDEEENVANIDEECPYCFSNDGYKVIGQVAPFGQVEEEITVEEEPIDSVEDDTGAGSIEDYDEAEIPEDEIVEESLNRKIDESYAEELAEREFKGPGLYDIYYYSIGSDGEESGDLLYNGESQEIIEPGDLQYIIEDINSHDSGRYVWNYNYCEKVGELEESLKEDCCKKGNCKNGALDECGDLEECGDSCAEEKDELEEDFKDVSITTDDSHMTMTSDEDGRVTVTTEPVHDEFEDEFIEDEVVGGDEMIAPVDDETVTEIEGEDEIAEPFDEEPLGGEEDIDIDIDEFDEEGFDGLGESYLKKVYENVNSFKTTGIREEKNKLYVEGLIEFTSGNKKKTSFIFEAKDIDSKGKIRFIGENKEITRGKKSFTVAGRMDGKKFMCESFNYNYRAKDENGKSTRLYGTIKK